MRRPSFLVSSVVVGALLASACGEAAVAPVCAASGTGSITISITGVPTGVTPSVSVTGPGGTTVVTATTTIPGLAGGRYTISSAPRAIADSLVSGYVRGTVPADGVCLRGGEVLNVPVQYAAIPSAGKVWVGSGSSSLAFTSPQLAATATLAPAVSADTRGSTGAAFDRDGNLWVRGQSATEPHLMRYSAASLGSSGNPTPERSINISGVNCQGSGAIALDESGNLWLSISCQNRVVRLTAAQLAVSGIVSPAVQITGLVAPEGLAFDAAGNLWLADNTHLRRFNAARLNANISAAADLRVTFTTPSPPSQGATGLTVNHLAFSPSGALWVSSYVNYALYRVESAIVAATGAQDTQVSRILYVSSFAQPRGFAFDNSGGVMIAYLGSSFARLSPTQLQSSVLLPNTVTPQRTYASSSIVAFAENVALFPAPATTPLYSRAR